MHVWERLLYRIPWWPAWCMLDQWNWETPYLAFQCKYLLFGWSCYSWIFAWQRCLLCLLSRPICAQMCSSKAICGILVHCMVTATLMVFCCRWRLPCLCKACQKLLFNLKWFKWLKYVIYFACKCQCVILSDHIIVWWYDCIRNISLQCATRNE